MTHDPHLGFIVAAYVLGFVVVAGMIVAVILDHRHLKRALTRFEAPGDRATDA